MTRLKKVLTDKKMSQKELAKLSDVAEYKISQLCMGKSKDLFMSTAKRICEVLNCTLDDAFGDIMKQLFPCEKLY